MVDPHTNGCPEPEVLAAYVDRGLSLTERARVDAHLASCPQCIALVAGVARTVEELSALRPDVAITAEATPLVTRRSIAGALAAAAAVIAVLATPALVRSWFGGDSGLVSLVESVGEQRSVLGRLTGGFPHAPLGVPSAGGQDGRAAGTDRVQLTAGRIRESSGERATPSQLHAIGVSQLLAGRYDDAAQSLLAASREQPANARYLNDVATVHLERARLGLRPDDLPRALAAADRARRLDPSLKEAWFNHALAVSALSLTAEARSAWTEYLKRDSASPWSGEARERLAQLEKPTAAAAWQMIEGRLQQPIDATTADEAVRTQTTEARHFIEATLIPAWANAVLSGGSGSTELDRLRVMSQAMLRVTGDALYVDVVAAIDGHAQPQALAAAHHQYAQAAALYADDRYGDAEPGLRNAVAALTAAGSPLAARARVDLASIDYVNGRYDALAQNMAPEVGNARTHRYGYVAARASWILGLSTFVQGRHGDARGYYEDALGEAESLKDAELVAGAHNLLASLFHYVGDETSTWIHLISALRGLDVTRSLKLRHGLLINAALIVRSVSEEAALAIQDEVVRNAGDWGREGAIAEAYAQRASILTSLNRRELAANDLKEARRQLAGGKDPAMTGRVEMIVLSAETDLLRSTNPPAAVKAAETAIALASARRDRLRVAQLQLRLAQANIVWGRDAAAQLALERGIAAFEEERRSWSDEARSSSRDELWGLFETSVQLAIKRKDYDRAFALSERARVRTLAEARTIATPRDLKMVQASLEANEAILALNQFDNELAVWVIRRTGASVITRPMTRAQAKQLVARQQDEVRLEASAPRAGRALYNEIMRPVAAQLKDVDRLVIVPDPTYEDAPFAAMWNDVTKHFLVQDVALRFAPSATAVAILNGSERRGAGSATALAVGAGDLARAEAMAVASLYRSSSLLVGEAATRPRLLADAPSFPVVHLAAPLVASSINPLLSQLVVADAAGVRHSGIVSGTDIASRPMTQTRLVVLDEVETSPSHRGEGTLSMARAFLAAGVPAVVGTLPGADERAARDLMIGFHREIANGVSAEQALSRVQRNAIQQNGGRLGAWTALVMYGSDR